MHWNDVRGFHAADHHLFSLAQHRLCGNLIIWPAWKGLSPPILGTNFKVTILINRQILIYLIA
jgi:hypothetical protein